MTTLTTTKRAGHSPEGRRSSGSGLNFGRILRSEWIKLSTLRSTVILLLVTLVVMVGIAALFAWAMQSGQSAMNAAANNPQAAAQMQGAPDFAQTALGVPSGGIIFGQLTLATLAVMLIASEWTTGMIRSTMVAVPKRIPVLLAKNVIVAVVAFVLGAVAALISYFVAQPILGVENIDFPLGHDGVIASILNTGTYLALIAVISMAIGTLLRNTAGGVVTAIGLFFVVPLIVVNLIAGIADWIPDAARFLPTNAGNQLVAITTSDGALTQLEGGLVMAAWAVGLLVISLVVAKRRDV